MGFHAFATLILLGWIRRVNDNSIVRLVVFHKVCVIVAGAGP